MHKDADQRSVDAFNFYSNLEQNAFDKGFKVSHNRGQGDCMFYALLEQLEFAKRPKEIPHSAAELRQKIVQYLQQNPKLVSNNNNDNDKDNDKDNGNGNGNSYGNVSGNGNDN